MIILIGCGKNKRTGEQEAQDMYIGNYFTTSLQYARTFNAPIYILSAKYGLLPLTQRILPYNQTLKTMSREECIEWSNMVKKQLDENHLSNEKAIFLCGSKYYQYLLDYFPEYETPLQNVGRMGYQIEWMRNKLRHKRKKLF